MPYESNTSLVTSVMREFCVLLMAVLFASIPFFAVQAQENPIAAFASADTAAKTSPR
jgi:hypothetical protein